METEATNIKTATEQIDKAIERGIDFLHQHQLHNGEFLCYLSGDDAMQEWNHPDSFVFPTMMIACSLLPLKKNPTAEKILVQSCKFIQYQMHWTGIGHYFTRLHPFRKLNPYDADDTAYGSYVLREMNFNFPGDLNKKILLDNRNNKGLFYTWFTLRLRLHRNKHFWRLALPELFRPVQSFFFWRSAACKRADVDAGVNANVLYYLGETEATLPVIDHLIKIITEQKEDSCDKWYRNPLTIYYFISRNCSAGIKMFDSVKEPIIERVLLKRGKDGCIGRSALETALAVIILLNFNYKGEELHNALLFLLSQQLSTGCWPRWRVYYAVPDKTAGYGSEELTTAFCLEAIALYRTLILGEDAG